MLAAFDFNKTFVNIFTKIVERIHLETVFTGTKIGAFCIFANGKWATERSCVQRAFVDIHADDRIFHAVLELCDVTIGEGADVRTCSVCTVLFEIKKLKNLLTF